MTVLVTGSNGFLGASLVDSLLTQGQTPVRCLVRSGSARGRLDAVAAKHEKAHLEIATGSLASKDKAAELLDGVTTIYHLAASLRGTAADMCLNTVVTSRNLLDAAVSLPRSPRIVLISSFSVYGVAELPRGHLVDEQTPLETQPLLRDLYAQIKLRQEELFWQYHREHKFEMVVLRPGVIYGPTGSAFSSRVGLQLPGIFLYLGGRNLLPLSYVDNCADAIATAGSRANDGEIYNVVDGDLPTCQSYLKQYRREVGPVRALRVPYPLLMLGSHLVERYHTYSKGQLPAIFTPYKTAAMWKGNTFDNSKLQDLGWTQRVTTEEALRRTFEHLRNARGAAA